MKINVKNPVLAQKFMTAFSCTGDECEDTCCQGWAVPFEKKAFLNIKKLYKKTGNTKHGRIKDILKRNRKAEDDWTYGILNITHQPCPFLDDNNLCDIHAKLGANKLGWVCKDYPRSLVTNNDQVEQVMSLSCPEAARLCLLHPDSTQMVEVHPDALKELSGHISVQGNEHGLDPYIQYRSDIRQVMQLLFDARQYDTNGRLNLLVYFAFKINDFYHENTTNFDINRLGSAIEHVADPNVHSKLVSDFHAQAYEPELSISIVQALIIFHADYLSGFNDFVKSCTTRGCHIDNAQKDAMSSAALTGVISTYFDRRNKVEAKHWQRIEGYFHNYTSCYIFNSLYLRAPSLPLFLRGLLIRLHIIKFLFFLNPLLDPLFIETEDASDKADHEALLDQAIVQTCYQCCRSLDHLHPKLMGIIAQVLDEKGVNDLEHLSVLAKV